MFLNKDLIGRSALIGEFVAKLEAGYAADIALMVCYGSFVSGKHGPLSDIDFYFIPKTDRGYEFSCQCIIGGIGYDLWPLTWDRLAGFANLEDSFASLLADGIAVWAGSEEDYARFSALQQRLRTSLEDEELCIKTARHSLRAAKLAVFELERKQHPSWRLQAVRAAEQILYALACLNGVHIRKGLANLESELAGMQRLPSGCAESYLDLALSRDAGEASAILRRLIDRCEPFLEPDSSRSREADPGDLSGFYEEFKSAYNKVLQACHEQSLVKAYQAAAIVDRETEQQLSGFAGENTFPVLLDLVPDQDYQKLSSACQLHEQQLLSLLRRYDIPVRAYATLADFLEAF